MTQHITQEQAEAFAHRRATKYVHRSAPGYASYAFVPHTLMDFVRDIEAAAIQSYIDSQSAQPSEPAQPEYFAQYEYAPDFSVLVAVYRRRADQTPELIHKEALPKQIGDGPAQPDALAIEAAHNIKEQP